MGLLVAAVQRPFGLHTDILTVWYIHGISVKVNYYNQPQHNPIFIFGTVSEILVLIITVESKTMAISSLPVAVELYGFRFTLQ
jgi:hypothetical protein